MYLILLFYEGFFSFSPFLNFRGYVPSTSRYRKEIIGGYIIPAVWTIITAIVNRHGDICDIANPRIGLDNCFFSTKYGNITFCSNYRT